MKPPEPRFPPGTMSTTSSAAADAMQTDAAESSGSGSSPLFPPSLVSYSVRGSGRRTVELGWYTPEGETVVIVPRSPDQSEESAEGLAETADEPEVEIPPGEPPNEKEPKDPSKEDREKMEKKKKKEEEIARLPVVERGPRDPPSDPPARAMKLAALRMPRSVSRDEDHGRQPVGKGEPWEQAMFLNPPVGKKDKWTPMMHGGWVMRAHGGLRERRFHPLHRKVPFDPNDLEELRVAVAFGRDGRRTIHRDRWLDGPGDQSVSRQGDLERLHFLRTEEQRGKPRWCWTGTSLQNVGEDGPSPYVPTA